jgi:hypothetical protein
MENNNRALTQVHRMEDNKWESTHVHTQWRTTNGNQPMSTKLILLGGMQPQNSGQKMGEDLQNLLVPGSQNHKKGVTTM